MHSPGRSKWPAQNNCPKMGECLMMGYNKKGEFYYRRLKLYGKLWGSKMANGAVYETTNGQNAVTHDQSNYSIVRPIK